MATRKSNAKVRAVQTSSGTKLVRAGSRAEAKYQAQGASFSNNAGTIDQARAESKARTSTRSANDPLTVSENAGFETPSYIAPPTITSNLLAPSTGINVPPPPVDTTGTKVMSQVSGLATAPPPPEMSEDPLKALISSMEQAPSADKIYAKVERDAQLKQKQQTVNNLQAQLGAITAKAQADKLSLEGQGRGVTEAIIGGQQAQIDREAAIQSLPIAAQLSAAQGDLESARDQVNTLFKLRLQDAQNKVDYRNKIAEISFNYANDKQKELITDRRRKEDQEWEIKRDQIKQVNEWANTALDNGQQSLFRQLAGLDHNSDTYFRDATEFAGSIAGKDDGKAFLSLSADEKKSLLSVGLNEDYINHLIDGVSSYGLEEVLRQENLTTAQEQAVKSVFAQGSGGLTREDISTISGIPDNQEGRGGFLGLFEGDSNSAKLNKLMSYVEIYRRAGLSEEDIAKKLSDADIVKKLLES